MKILPDNTGPIASFANNAAAARLWFGAFCVALLLWGLDRHFVTASLKARQKVVIMTPANEFLAAEELEFDEAESLQEYLLNLCLVSFYTRNPTGLAYPDIFKRAFIEPAQSKLFNDIQNEQKFFADNQVSQSVQIINWEVFTSGTSRLTIASNVQLIRTGAVAVRTVALDPAFERVQLDYEINPNMRNAGYFPLGCFSMTRFPMPNLKPAE
jgi:hypothetical protein